MEPRISVDTVQKRKILSHVEVTTDRLSDWMIGFIDTLYKVLGTTGNYSAIALLNTLQFTFTHALGSSVFTKSCPGNELIIGSLQITHEVFPHSLIPFSPLFCN
jgi:hypothetical protein